MAGPKEAWEEVGKNFSELGRKLEEHYRKAGTEVRREGGVAPAGGDVPAAGAAPAAPNAVGEEDPGTAEERHIKVNQAVRTLTDELDRAFTSLGNTIRDPAVGETVGRAARSLGDALSTTFSEASDQIRRRIKPDEDRPS
jgi:hypothetical protein